MELLSPEIMDQIKPYTGDESENESTAERAIMAGNVMMQTKTAYTTAVKVQEPRRMAKIAHNVLQEAALAGSSFFYAWEVKDRRTGRSQRIEGPSIDLAMSMARNYGNCAIDVNMQDVGGYYLFTGIFVDLETGFTCPRLFRQRKGQNTGMKDTERQEDIVFQIGQSKAIRNAVVRAMPEWLVAKAIETAKDAELGKIKPENMHLARTRAISFFEPYGVTTERMESNIGRPVDQWTPQDIVNLRGMATAVKEGRVSADELFPAAEPEKKIKPDDPKPELKKERKHAEKTTPAAPVPVAEGGGDVAKNGIGNTGHNGNQERGDAPIHEDSQPETNADPTPDEIALADAMNEIDEYYLRDWNEIENPWRVVRLFHKSGAKKQPFISDLMIELGHNAGMLDMRCKAFGI